MRRHAITVALLVGLAAPVPTASEAAPRPPRTGVTSPNVTWVTTIPVEAGVATGARIVGRHLYVGGVKSFSIYDIADPLQPTLLSVTPIGFVFPSEDVDTNGEILLMNDEQGPVGTLQVWDVRDKRAPALLATVDDVRDHTFSCVLGCRWAYGSRGTVVDLRVPVRPVVAGRWADLPRNDGFDVTEVSPGIVLTASRTMRLLDARRDPTRPVVIGGGTTADRRLLHSVRWPRAGRDRFALVQGETPLSGRCTDQSGAIMTFDSSGPRRVRELRLVDSFRVTNGSYVDGDPAAGAWGCTAMWFQHHPSFRDGGLVAAGFFEHGVRFLRVDAKGRISETGRYMPAGGSTIAAYWATPEIVYAIDLHRGIDVLRYDLAAPDAVPAPDAGSRRISFSVPDAPVPNDALWCQSGSLPARRVPVTSPGSA